MKGLCYKTNTLELYLILVRFSHLYVAKTRNKETRRTRSSTSGQTRMWSKKEQNICSYTAVAHCTVTFRSRSTITFPSSRRDCRSGYAPSSEHGKSWAMWLWRSEISIDAVSTDMNDIPSRWSEKGASITVPGQPVAGMRTDCFTVID